MLKVLRFNFVVFFLICTSLASGQDFFSSGDWYKFGVTETGIHSIGLEELRGVGLDISSPENIHVYGGSPEMLPQRLDLNTSFEPEEISFWFDSNSDQGEAVYFLGRGPQYTFVNDFGELETDFNLYSDTIFYYFTVSEEGKGNVVSTLETSSSLSSSPVLLAYDYYEKDEVNLLGSGREWFSNEMSSQSPKSSFSFDISDFTDNLNLAYNVVGTSPESDMHLDLYVEGELMSSADIGSTNKSYGIKVKSSSTSFEVANDILDGDILNVDLELRDKENMQSKGYLDYLSVTYDADEGALKEDVPYYSVLGSEGISGIKNTNLKLISTDLETGSEVIISGLNVNGGHDFVLNAFNAEVLFFESGKLYSKPVFKNKVEPFNLTVSDDPELVILFHKDFKTDVERLVEHKESLGLTVHAVDVDEVFDNYSSGKRDVSAIRNYLKYVYDASNSFKYLLVFGDCSYDFKNRISTKKNFVPVYQSRQSFHDVQTYASDDYYGFLDNTDGDWLESSSGNHFLNIAVGRLPVKDELDASIIVDKIIKYETETETSNWKNNIVFVADDGDKALHVKQVNQLVDQVQESSPFIVDEKIYIDAYDKSDGVSDIVEDLKDAIDDGALVVNFTGHGTEFSWTEEEVLTIPIIKKLTNVERLPLFVTATCEFGRFDDPSLVSGAESLLLEEAGAIGLVTTTRPVYSSSNFTINQAFYKELFSVENSSYRPLGDVFKSTKNTSLNNVFNRNFSLLGDPSLSLKLPDREIKLLELNSISSEIYNDTIALGETFTLEAEVNSFLGVNDSLYNGMMTISFYDEAQIKETQGNSGQLTVEYEENKNLVLETQLPVVNGVVTGELLFPPGINPAVREMDVVFYSYSHQENVAYGVYEGFVVGDIAEGLVDKPMEILSKNVPLEDGTYRANTEFLFEINDENGLLFSSHLIGKDNYAVLDGGEKILLNDLLYLPEGEVGKAELKIDFVDLLGGEHELEIFMYDALGNEMTYVFTFTVGNSITINLYPNPVNDKLFLGLQRSNSERELVYNIEIYNLLGVSVLEKSEVISSGELDFTENILANYNNFLSPGVYNYEVRVKYPDGNEFTSKGMFTKI